MSLNFALKGIIESNQGQKEENLNKVLEIMSSLKLIPEDRRDMFNVLIFESILLAHRNSLRIYLIFLI